MSSIFGLLKYNDAPADAQQLKRMQQALNHYNADDTGMWVSGNIGLGHLMLYNTPESLQEKLPLNDSLSGLSITADARIDNREELFNKLDLPPSLKYTIPDSSLILKAYEKYGEGCVKHLVGDFAFAIWDSKEQKLFCARDHMGVKPFFYYNDGHCFAFATEKKGILTLNGINDSIDKTFFYHNLIYPIRQAPEATLYQHIRRLKPAHSLILSLKNRQLKIDQYWTLDAETELRLANKQDYYDGLRHYFKQAVACRTRSAYSIGSQLSGGMDSSGVCSVANSILKQAGRGIISFSNVVSDTVDEQVKKKSERKYVDAVIDFSGIKDSVFVANTFWNDPLEESDFYLEVNEGPESMDLLWELPIMRAGMEKGVRTMLSGFTGDEMVTHRGHNYHLSFLAQKKYLKYFLSKQQNSYAAFPKTAPFIPGSIEQGIKRLKAALGIYDARIKIASEFYNIPEEYKRSAFLSLPGNAQVTDRLKSFRHMQKAELLSPAISLRLEFESRYSAYFRMEMRYPMADIRLTQFYLSIPDKLKFGIPEKRDLYRNAISTYLPEIVLKRDDKVGNNAPFLPQWRQKRHMAVVDLLKTRTYNNIIKNKLIYQKIQHLINVKEMNKDKEYIMRTQTPNIHTLRWIEKNIDRVNKFL